MKNTIKKFLTLAGLMLGLAVLAPKMALALPLEDSEVRLNTPRSFWYEARANSSTLVNLYYVGAGTQATISVDADSINAEVPYGTADDNFGTSGAYDITASAYDTLGELCDAIDGLADYGCELTGGKRDDDPLLLRDRAGDVGDNLKGAGGFDIKSDTGPVVVGAGDASLSTLLTVGFNPASNKQVVLKKCEVNGNVIGDYRVYGKSALYSVNTRSGARQNASISDTQENWRDITADDTAESYSWVPEASRSAGDGWHFARGEHVVVRFGEGAVGTSIQLPPNFIRCLFEER